LKHTQQIANALRKMKENCGGPGNKLKIKSIITQLRAVDSMRWQQMLLRMRVALAWVVLGGFNWRGQLISF